MITPAKMTDSDGEKFKSGGVMKNDQIARLIFKSFVGIP